MSGELEQECDGTGGHCVKCGEYVSFASAVNIEEIVKVAEEMKREQRPGGVLAGGQAGQLTSDAAYDWSARLLKAVGREG